MSSDNLKTLVYLGVASVLATIAFFTYPWIKPIEPSQDIGKPLFDPERFTTENVASLQIVRYDSAAARFDDFQVKRDRRGVWTIPSSDDYPADADQQMRAAITSLEALTIVDVIPDSENLFQDFGVIEPNEGETEVGQTGVGTLITVRDSADEIIGNLIIGNSDENQTNLRFVRRPGQPLIYVVEYDPSVLRTDFREWIDKDLLQIDTVDITRLDIDDYQVLIPETGDGTGQRTASIRSRFRATVRSEATRWALERFLEYDAQGVPTERTIGENEELNHVRLNQVASALDGLEIVDVVRKPAGLGVDLKAIDTVEEIMDLNDNGYIPAQTADGSLELKSVNGDVFVDTRDGLRYTLRFGNIRQEEGNADASLDRYMMVAVALDESAFPMPELPAISIPADDLPPAPAGDSDAPAPDPAAGSDGGDGSGEADGDGSQGDGGATSDSPAPMPTPATETPEAGDGDQSATTLGATRFVSLGAAQEAADDEAQRRREAELRRLIDERNARLEAAQRQVEELNRRFGDWYYVVSEKSFKEIRLERTELIVPKGSTTPDPEVPGLPQ